MTKKHIHIQDTSKKWPSHKANFLKNLAITTALAGALSAPLYGQTNKTTNNKTITTEQENKIDTSKVVNYADLVDKNDSIEHERIIHTNVDSILQEYGEEKGMEIIKEHLLIEINIQRKKRDIQPLIRDSLLNIAAQKHAEDMYNNHYFSHINMKWEDINYRIQKTWYKKKNNNENYAHWPSTIRGVMDTWMNSRLHKRSILNYEDIWIWYINKTWVVDFGWDIIWLIY